MLVEGTKMLVYSYKIPMARGVFQSWWWEIPCRDSTKGYVRSLRELCTM